MLGSNMSILPFHFTSKSKASQSQIRHRMAAHCSPVSRSSSPLFSSTSPSTPLPSAKYAARGFSLMPMRSNTIARSRLQLRTGPHFIFLSLFPIFVFDLSISRARIFQMVKGRVTAHSKEVSFSPLIRCEEKHLYRSREVLHVPGRRELTSAARRNNATTH